MFCINCGAKITDGAKFCVHCGAKQSLPDEQISISNNAATTNLVPAKCTNCGGQLTVDPAQQAAVCPFCNSAFIVEQAINNYNIKMNGNMNIGTATINVQGLNTENLIARAKSYEARNKLEIAMDYFNQVLDIDINNREAIFGVHRIQEKMKNYVFFTAVHKTFFGDNSIIEVRQETLTMIKGIKKEVYYINKIENEAISGKDNDQFIFSYPGRTLFVVWKCGKQSQELYDYVKNAKRGIYPDYR